MNNPFSRNKINIDIDMHCHVLPKKDSDPETVNQALDVMKVFQYFGVHTIYATPHIRLSQPSNTIESINARAEIFKQQLADNGIKINFNVVAEYSLDEGFMKILEAGKMMTYPESYLLLELPLRKKPENFKETIKTIISKGYKPVIGHPELHSYLRYDWQTISELKEMGCSFQLNLIDMSGYFGDEAINASANLLRSKTYDLLGTGAHSRGQLRMITEGVLQQKEIINLLSNNKFKNSIFSCEKNTSTGFMAGIKGYFKR